MNGQQAALNLLNSGIKRLEKNVELVKEETPRKEIREAIIEIRKAILILSQ